MFTERTQKVTCCPYPGCFYFVLRHSWDFYYYLIITLLYFRYKKTYNYIILHSRPQLKTLTPHSPQNRILVFRNILKRCAYVAGPNENVRLFDNLLWNYRALCSRHKLALFYYLLSILF